MLSDYDAICDALEEHWDNQSSSAFKNALHELHQLAESGHIEACEYLAEILSLHGIHHDASQAYKWYYIALSQSGYSVTFQNMHDEEKPYAGPVGDFRNESVVNELVSELGCDRVKQLDVEAQSWLASHGLKLHNR